MSSGADTQARCIVKTNAADSSAPAGVACCPLFPISRLRSAGTGYPQAPGPERTSQIAAAVNTTAPAISSGLYQPYQETGFAFCCICRLTSSSTQSSAQTRRKRQIKDVCMKRKTWDTISFVIPFPRSSFLLPDIQIFGYSL